MHTIPWITQKLYFKTGIPQTLLISERCCWSHIAFITKILQMCCRKNRIAISSFIGTYFSIKRQKRATRPNKYFKANQLEIRPKDQLKVFWPTNLKRGEIFEVCPKRGQSGKPGFNLFLLLVGGGCALSISPCRLLHTYLRTHPAYNIISAYIIVWWLLSCDFCQWCHLARSFHNQIFQAYHQILIDEINVKSFILIVILA